eukprot:TRINITY_DN3736_c0_g4_i1.p4 TRINITY_DN3736_c0_g4~~TRINITY_DN3736_c0_g4_i1.p4  ORF type:complete len:125 (+),score=2.40 TRINITY_DN3736_c0_g4_i1:106-480(+)
MQISTYMRAKPPLSPGHLQIIRKSLLLYNNRQHVTNLIPKKRIQNSENQQKHFDNCKEKRKYNFFSKHRQIKTKLPYNSQNFVKISQNQFQDNFQQQQKFNRKKLNLLCCYYGKKYNQSFITVP